MASTGGDVTARIYFAGPTRLKRQDETRKKRRRKKGGMGHNWFVFFLASLLVIRGDERYLRMIRSMILTIITGDGSLGLDSEIRPCHFSSCQQIIMTKLDCHDDKHPCRHTHSPTHPLAHSPILQLSHSPTHPLTHSLTHSPLLPFLLPPFPNPPSPHPVISSQPFHCDIRLSNIFKTFHNQPIDFVRQSQRWAIVPSSSTAILSPMPSTGEFLTLASPHMARTGTL